METRISVIIPVYNVEKYIAECISSVTSQSFDGCEVVCVDDGSSDGSLTVMQGLAEADPRIKVFSQKNCGQSMARNNGLSHACGKYVIYLDSDDLLLPGSLQKLWDAAEEDSLDTVYFDATSFCEDESCSAKAEGYRGFYNRKHDYPGVWEGHDLMSAMFRNSDYIVSPCLQMARRDFLIENGCDFRRGIIHEDNLYTFKTMLSARRCGYLKEILYSRRVRPESIMTQKVSARHVYGYFICYLEMKDFLRSSPYRDEESLWDILYCVLLNTRKECEEMYANGDDLPQLHGYELIAYMAEVTDPIAAYNRGLSEGWATAPAAPEKKGLAKRALSSIREKGLGHTLRRGCGKIARKLGLKKDKK